MIDTHRNQRVCAVCGRPFASSRSDARHCEGVDQVVDDADVRVGADSESFRFRKPVQILQFFNCRPGAHRTRQAFVEPAPP